MTDYKVRKSIVFFFFLLPLWIQFQYVHINMSDNPPAEKTTTTTTTKQ